MVFLYSIWPLFNKTIFNPSNSQDTLDALERRKTLLYKEIQYIDAEYIKITGSNNADHSSATDYGTFIVAQSSTINIG